MTAALGFDVVSALAADAATVWRHASTPAGVNAELGPLLDMTFPPSVGDLGDVAPRSAPVRAWIRLAHLLPVERDDFVLAAFEPGRRFLEESVLLTQRRWRHERIVTSDGDGSRLTDRLRFEPRVEPLGSLHWAVFRAVFAWRHRRARRLFGARPLRFGLETERLVVRPWRNDDHDALRALATNAAVMRFIGDGHLWSEEEVEEFIRQQARLEAVRGIALGAVTERASGEIVGLGGLQPLASTDDIEVGWWLRPSCVGRGYATEVGAAALRFAFDVAGAERVVAVVHPENARSRAVATRLGMRSHGTARGFELGLRTPEAIVERFTCDRRTAGAA